MSEEPSTPPVTKPGKAAKKRPADKPKIKAKGQNGAEKLQPAEQPTFAAAPAAEPAPPIPQAPEPAAQPAPSTAFAVQQLLSQDQRAMLEALSANLARAALTAQGAIAEAALRQAEHPPALSADPFHVAPALTEVIGRLAAQPDRMVRAQADLFQRYLELWQSAARRAGGESVEPVVRPAGGDKRFNDPDWNDNPVFDVIKQSYLVTSNWLNALVSDVDNVDPMSKRRVEFFMKMLTDAFAPSNFLVSNPAALREAMSTRGESLLRGMENFAQDLERGGGQLSISQTDYETFKIGENVATAPGKVIYQNALMQILQFSPSTEQAHEVPLLIFPPWINKYYILDLRAENSMIRWLTAQGFSVFVTSWVNPDSTLAAATFEDYLKQGLYEAVDKVLEQSGAEQVNTVGYCIGGTLLGTGLAHMAARKDSRIASATFFATQQDFTEAGDLLLFTNEDWLGQLEKQMDAGGGVLPGQTMAETFNSLRANDLIWSFFVNNYLMGKEPKPFDLLFWNSDQTRMPKTLHLYYLRKFYGENAFAKGELVLDNIRLDLSQVKTPVYVQSSRDDHIAPARSVYRGAKLFGGPVTFTLSGSGHIAGVINAPVANKYQHWTNSDLPDTVERWLDGAVETPGSWWPHWSLWLKERSGGMVPARDPAKGPFAPLEDAPGSYVKVKG